MTFWNMPAKCPTVLNLNLRNEHIFDVFCRNVGIKSASHTGMDTASVIITSVHFELTEAIKSVVHEKMNKLFRHEPDIIRVRVELTKDVDKKDKNAFEAKGTIELRGPNFIVSTFSDNLYNAIDDLEDKLLRKLRNRARLMKTKRKEACIGG